MFFLILKRGNVNNILTISVFLIGSVTDSEADRVVQEEPVLQSVDQPSEEFTEVSNSGVRATDVDTTLKLASPEVLSSSLQQGLSLNKSFMFVYFLQLT